jgi:hypothetical protein
MLASRVTEDPRPPHLLHGSVSRALSDVLMKAMARRPVDRYADVDAFLDALLDTANVGPVALPRRRAAEVRLVSGASTAWPPVGPVLSLAQLEDLGLSQLDLAQVPDAEVVSITDEDEAPEPDSLPFEDVTQAADFSSMKPLLDAGQAPRPPAAASRPEGDDQTAPLFVPPHLSTQQTTPALNPVFGHETTDPTAAPLPPEDRTNPAGASKPKSPARTTVPDRGPVFPAQRPEAPLRAAPPEPERPVGVWAVVAFVALGVGAAIAWAVTR